jgi:hypothetical protein
LVGAASTIFASAALVKEEVVVAASDLAAKTPEAKRATRAAKSAMTSVATTGTALVRLILLFLTSTYSRSDRTVAIACSWILLRSAGNGKSPVTQAEKVYYLPSEEC